MKCINDLIFSSRLATYANVVTVDGELVKLSSGCALTDATTMTQWNGQLVISASKLSYSDIAKVLKDINDNGISTKSVKLMSSPLTMPSSVEEDEYYSDELENPRLCDKDLNESIYDDVPGMVGVDDFRLYHGCY